MNPKTPRFGTTTKITQRNGITTTQVTKFHDGDITRIENISEERVPIIQIQDANTIFEKMHLEHAFSNYGAWVEKNPKSGKLYVVKCWQEVEQG